MLSPVRRAHVEFALDNATDVANFVMGLRGVVGLIFRPRSLIAWVKLVTLIKRAERFLSHHPETWVINVT